MYVISRCLLGVNCKYNGGNNFNDDVANFCKHHEYMTVCPEAVSGLSTPRPPAEYSKNGRITDKEGKDVTAFFRRGAELALEEVIKAEGDGSPIEGAILKANSPSCGSGKIYDGTFSGKLIDGNGCFAQKLIDRGIEVISEKEIEDGKF